MKAIGSNVSGVQGDVAKLADLDRLYEIIAKVKGRIDIDAPGNDHKVVTFVNVRTSVACMKAAYRLSPVRHPFIRF